MKKSELKKRLVEALTPDEAAKVEPKYKETYAAMIKGKGPLKLKKYDNPDKVVRGRVVNTIKNESLKIAEKLGKTADVGDYKDDFRKSDAPQFKGKSKKKRDQMATAAFLNKEDLDVGHQDDEPRMIKKDIYNMGKYAMELYKKLDQYDDMEGEVDFPHWWQSKITKAKSMLQSAYDYLDGEERISQIDAIMQESAYDAGRLEKKVKAILKKEGGAVGLKPLVDAAKELGASKKDLISILKKMKDVKTHKDGDIIDTAGLNETGQEIAKKNMDDYKRLNELVKAALMGPMNETSTDKYDNNPALKGKQSDLPDGLQKAIIKKSKGKVDEYDSAPPNDNVFFRGKTKAGDNPNADKEEKVDEDLDLGHETNESFSSLAKKVDKQKGVDKEYAGKIAGKIANIKRKGGGKGPTAKQKKRMAETILKELRG